MDLAIPSAWAFLLVLFRASGLLLSVPVLGARTIPTRVKLGLALALTAAAWTGAGSPTAAPPDTLPLLFGAAAKESVLGLLAGFAARATLQAALAAGQLASTASGIGFGSIVDPTSGVESNAVGELLHVAAQAGALAMGLHREAVAWLVRSVRAFPPGAPQGFGALALRAIQDSTGASALAVRLAFPVLAAVLLGHVAMAVMSRMAPQLSLQHVGFSMALVAGGGALWLVAPAIADAVARAAVAALAAG